MNLGDEILQHGFGGLEIRDHAVFHGPDGLNILGRSSQHLLGLCAYGDDPVDAAMLHFHCNDRGLRKNNALVAGVYQGVCSAQINGKITGEHPENPFKDHRCPLLSQCGPV